MMVANDKEEEKKEDKSLFERMQNQKYLIEKLIKLREMLTYAESA